MMDEAEFAAAFSQQDTELSSKKTIKKPKVWGREVSEEELRHVLAWSKGEINFVELMRLTNTNNSSAYSLIARAFRQAVKQGVLIQTRQEFTTQA